MDVTDSGTPGESEKISRCQAILSSLPIAIMLEDLSEVKRNLNQLNAQGITNIAQHCRNHPQAVDQIYKGMKILGLNQAAVEIFGFSSIAEFHQRSSEIMLTNSGSYLKEILAISGGEKEYHQQKTARLLDGKVVDMAFSWYALGKNGDIYAKVLVYFRETAAENEFQLALRRHAAALRMLSEIE